MLLRVRQAFMLVQTMNNVTMLMETQSGGPFAKFVLPLNSSS